MLIVLEGLDGAGKSTQVRKLRDYLGQKCPKWPPASPASALLWRLTN